MSIQVLRSASSLVKQNGKLVVYDAEKLKECCCTPNVEIELDCPEITFGESGYAPVTVTWSNNAKENKKSISFSYKRIDD